MAAPISFGGGMLGFPTVVNPPEPAKPLKKFIDYGEGIVYLRLPVALFTAWAAVTGAGVGLILAIIF